VSNVNYFLYAVNMLDGVDSGMLQTRAGVKDFFLD